MSISALAEKDLKTVLAIEQAGTAFPWQKQHFMDCISAGYHCLKLQQADEIIGFTIVSLHHGDADILNFGIAPAWQRQGHGQYLMQYIFDLAHEHKVKTIFLEVRVSNHKAQHLYQKLGFNEIGIRKNYYPAPDGHEDAILMAKEL